jgi:hypothetical protein
MRSLAVVLAAWALCLFAASAVRANEVYVAYDPCCATPVAVTTYYTPVPPVAFGSPAVVRTRYRPVLGGRVTRIRSVNAPAVYASPWCSW